MVAGDITVAPGVTLYQLTEYGLALQATIQGTNSKFAEAGYKVAVRASVAELARASESTNLAEEVTEPTAPASSLPDASF